HGGSAIMLPRLYADWARSMLPVAALMLPVMLPVMLPLVALMLPGAAWAQSKPAAPKTGSAVAAAAPAPAAREPDLAYGAYQRGFYLTAFSEATKRVEEKADPKAMTLLGELYAQGFGIAADDKKAAEWYRLAVA